MAAVHNPARLFVNTIVSEYDTLCHPGDAKIADVFDPPLEKGIKEFFLQSFSDELSTDGKGTIQEKTNKKVAACKQQSPTLSHLFAITGILDTHRQKGSWQKLKYRISPILGLGNSSNEDKLEEAKVRIIEALIQDHLRVKDYKLDPMPLVVFIGSKSHFYGQIFLEVYSRCSVTSKRKIIRQLETFQPQLESYSFRFQRVVFKIEGAFNRIIANRNVKLGLFLALNIGAFYVDYKVITLAGAFFNSAAFAGMSSGAARYMPALIVQISSRAYNRLVGIVVYVASTRLYPYLYLGKLVPFVITKRFTETKWVFYPVATVAATCYQWSFGPSAQVQEAIAKSLKDCSEKRKQELLEGGMKAYQIWMYLVEQGPQKGLFKAARTH